jgi:hypothetical protein
MSVWIPFNKYLTCHFQSRSPSVRYLLDQNEVDIIKMLLKSYQVYYNGICLSTVTEIHGDTVNQFNIHTYSYVPQKKKIQHINKHTIQSKDL